MPLPRGIWHLHTIVPCLCCAGKRVHSCFWCEGVDRNSLLLQPIISVVQSIDIQKIDGKHKEIKCRATFIYHLVVYVYQCQIEIEIIM